MSSSYLEGKLKGKAADSAEPAAQTQRAADCSAALRLRVTTPITMLAYLISALRLAVPPSATSTSNSILLPFAANGCQATTLCLPAGTSLSSNEPSSLTTV